jgi:hypothetical protein
MAQGRCQGRGFAGSKSTVSIALAGAQSRIERAARPRGDLRPRLLDTGDASVIRLMHEGKRERAGAKSLRRGKGDMTQDHAEGPKPNTNDRAPVRVGRGAILSRCPDRPNRKRNLRTMLCRRVSQSAASERDSASGGVRRSREAQPESSRCLATSAPFLTPRFTGK